MYFVINIMFCTSFHKRAESKLLVNSYENYIVSNHASHLKSESC